MIERKPKNVNFADDCLEAIERVQQIYQSSFSWAVNHVIREWMRCNPDGVITVGGNNHEPNKTNL